ncbi:hypothetical protein V2W30_36725 [Streptomyces sp. Q6]|uniref:Uncharacterized protein n=1 Tax=Streptomyces citrinus TaxID=3118173 RepID=A0ACD5APZ0_9ACTN
MRLGAVPHGGVEQGPYEAGRVVPGAALVHDDLGGTAGGRVDGGREIAEHGGRGDAAGVSPAAGAFGALAQRPSVRLVLGPLDVRQRMPPARPAQFTGEPDVLVGALPVQPVVGVRGLEVGHVGGEGGAGGTGGRSRLFHDDDLGARAGEVVADAGAEYARADD